MLTRRKLRRALGAVLIVAGGLLMWLAPARAFGGISMTGIVLMLAGIVLEIAGMLLEHRQNKRSQRRSRP